MADILLVCSGNTCRSPMAEEILRNKINEWGGPALRVSSAGLMAIPGQEATRESRQVMAEVGWDIGAHRSRRLHGDMIEAAALVITMESWQCDTLRDRFPEQAERIFNLGELAGSKSEEVYDPYGGDLEQYRITARQLQQLIDQAKNILKIETGD